MAYIRTKTIKGKQYSYLQKSVRVGNKVQTKHLKYIGKTDYAPVNRSEEPLLAEFVENVDYVNAKKEFGYSTDRLGTTHRVDGKKETVSFGTISDDFLKDDIITIHNHPYENPPSDGDIFAFLYTGTHKKDSVVLPSGKTYTLIRTKKTDKLSFISIEKVRELRKKGELTSGVIDQLNSDFHSKKRAFHKHYRNIQRILVVREGIKTQEELTRRTFELQETMLYEMAKFYNYEIEVKDANVVI